MDRRTFVGAGLAGLLPAVVEAAPLSAGDAGDDMAVLREALALHPGLLRYATAAQVEARLTALARDFAAATSLDARYLLLSRFLATIRCGHSYGNFFNQRDAVASALFDRPTRLPFHFRWIGDAMLVTEGFQTGLPAGTIVTAIDGVAPVVLRERLRPLIRTDGHNEGKRTSLLEVRGNDRIETFDVFQGLVAPPREGRFRLTVATPAGDRTIEVLAIGLAARRAQMAPASNDPSAPRWQWAMRPDGIAVLTMPGWAMWDSKWDWRGWLDDRLDGLVGARGLVVDLRDNEGGADCGDVILARYLDAPYTAPSVEQRLRFRRTPAKLDPFLDTWDQSFRTLGVGASPLPGGFFRRPDGGDAMRIEPAGRRLRVPLAVLTAPVNSSATFQFAATVRAIGAGRLVGRETGGNRRGINGGCFFFVRLPASGIEFDLPLVGYFPTRPQPDAGILPDIVAAPTVDDIRHRRDPAMTAAVAALHRN